MCRRFYETSLLANNLPVEREVQKTKKGEKMKFKRSHEEECYIQYPEDVKKIREYLEEIGTLEATDVEIDDYWGLYSDEKFCAGWMGVNEDLLDMFADWLESQLSKNSSYDNESAENTSPVVVMITTHAQTSDRRSRSGSGNR